MLQPQTLYIYKYVLQCVYDAYRSTFTFAADILKWYTHGCSLMTLQEYITKHVEC